MLNWLLLPTSQRVLVPIIREPGYSHRQSRPGISSAFQAQITRANPFLLHGRMTAAGCSLPIGWWRLQSAWLAVNKEKGREGGGGYLKPGSISNQQALCLWICVRWSLTINTHLQRQAFNLHAQKCSKGEQLSDDTLNMSHNWCYWAASLLQEVLVSLQLHKHTGAIKSIRECLWEGDWLLSKSIKKSYSLEVDTF